MTSPQLSKSSIDELYEAIIVGFNQGKYQEPFALEVPDDRFSDCGIVPGDHIYWYPASQQLSYGHCLR